MVDCYGAGRKVSLIDYNVKKVVSSVGYYPTRVFKSSILCRNVLYRWSREILFNWQVQ